MSYPSARPASPTGRGAKPEMSQSLTVSMAVAAGVAVANIYYNQPMLGIMESALRSPVTGYIPTATQLGYAAGLFLLVPLGDLIERKRLIVVQFLGLAGALLAAAMAPGAPWLLLASLAVGAMATVAQQIVPLAAHLAPEDRRGRMVGTVMAGLLCGILLSRTVAGFVATHAGWREMYWLGVPLALAMAVLMACRLPVSRPNAGIGYGRLLASMGELWRKLPELRKAAFTQGALFAGFSMFWTVLALHLQEPRFGLGADAAGLFGIVGAVGILAAPIAGRVADRHGPRRVILMGTTLSLAAWLIFGLWDAVFGMALGVIVLDFAVQSVLVSNQHIIYALMPEARSRINTIFMGTMFLCGAVGSGTAMAAWSTFGWMGVVVLGGILACVGVLIQRHQDGQKHTVAR